jgi:hypothetical protein
MELNPQHEALMVALLKSAKKAVKKAGLKPSPVLIAETAEMLYKMHKDGPATK